ncbi:hypothetical protein E4U24_006884, partial [Claviceps purpurea]
VYENRSWNISRIVALVVKHVLAIASLGGKVFEIAILANAMLQAELLPELASNCGTRLSAHKSIRWDSYEERIVLVPDGVERPMGDTYCCCRTAQPGS